MKVSIQTSSFPGAPNGAFVEVEVTEDSTFEEIKNLLEVQLKIPGEYFRLIFKGDGTIPDNARLGDVGVEDKDMMACEIRPPQGRPPYMQPRMASNAMVTSRAKAKENMMHALDATPEAFAEVTMLYVDAEVNGVPVKAFVDSGAQRTVMSKECAQRTKVMEIVDTDFAGVAVGVGAAKILGVMVLDQSQNIDLLLGLDMLKKYRCSIDLEKNVLKFGGSRSELKFLPESELPAHARLHNR